MSRRNQADRIASVRRDLVRALARDVRVEPFQPRYRGDPVGGQVVGWPDRLRSYFWPTPGVDLGITARLMEPWFERAGGLSTRLVQQGAWTADERADATALAWGVLAWGGTTRQADFSRPVVEAVFRRALGLPGADDAPMSSGWSKVAALATGYLEGRPDRAPQVIWDSRVSASIVFRLDAAMAREGGPAASGASPRRVFPRIGIVSGRGGSRTIGGAREPSRLRLRWAYAYGRWSSQDAASELVRELRDELNDGGYPPMPTPKGRSVPWTIRGVESVLFMDGY